MDGYRAIQKRAPLRERRISFEGDRFETFEFLFKELFESLENYITFKYISVFLAALALSFV